MVGALVGVMTAQPTPNTLNLDGLAMLILLTVGYAAHVSYHWANSLSEGEWLHANRNHKSHVRVTTVIADAASVLRIPTLERMILCEAYRTIANPRYFDRS